MADEGTSTTNVSVCKQLHTLNPKAEIEAIDRSVADLRTLISVVRERVQPLGRREDEFLG